MKRLSLFASTAFSTERGDPNQRRKKELGRRFVVNVRYGGNDGIGGGSGGGGIRWREGAETPMMKSPSLRNSRNSSNGSTNNRHSVVPSILSSQALALLNMKNVLRNERVRQLKALQSRLIAEGATSTEELSTVEKVIELQPAPRGGNYSPTKTTGPENEDKDENEDDQETKVPSLPPRSALAASSRQRQTGHRRPKTWTRSDFVQLQVRTLDDGGSPSSLSGVATIRGYLLKRRAFIGGWARRFFVVIYPHLMYFVSAEDHASGIEARGIFDLSKCKVGRGNGMFDIVLFCTTKN